MDSSLHRFWDLFEKKFFVLGPETDKRKCAMKIRHGHFYTFTKCTFLFVRLIKTVKKTLLFLKNLILNALGDNRDWQLIKWNTLNTSSDECLFHKKFVSSQIIVSKISLGQTLKKESYLRYLRYLTESRFLQRWHV